MRPDQLPTNVQPAKNATTKPSLAIQKVYAPRSEAATPPPAALPELQKLEAPTNVPPHPKEPSLAAALSQASETAYHAESPARTVLEHTIPHALHTAEVLIG